MLTGERSGNVLQSLFTNTRIVLNDEYGREYILTLTRLISFTLRNENCAEIIRIVCAELVIVARDEVSGGKVLESMVNFVKRVSHQPELITVAEGFVVGLKLFLIDVNPPKMKNGMARIMRLLYLYNSVSPKKKSTSTGISQRDLSSADPFNSPFISHLDSHTISN